VDQSVLLIRIVGTLAKASATAIEYQQRQHGIASVADTFGEVFPDGSRRSPEQTNDMVLALAQMQSQLEELGNKLLIQGKELRDLLKKLGLQRVKSLHQPYDVIELIYELPRLRQFRVEEG
jgi:N-acetylglutamate synthase/N-acetylornithine aminotransferase